MGESISLGTVGEGVDGFQLAATTTRGFDDVVAALAAAIDLAGLRLLNVIDVQQALAGAGRRIGPFRLMFFFHPSLVVRVLEASVAAMVEAPLKLVVAEAADGTVSMRIAEPAAAFGRYNNAALAALGTELSATVRGIVAQAT